jgi:hypothetical protein
VRFQTCWQNGFDFKALDLKLRLSRPRSCWGAERMVQADLM